MNMKQLFFKSPNSNLRHLRIADDCMDGVGETAPPRHGYCRSTFSNCYSPRRLLAWLLRPLRLNSSKRQNDVCDSKTPIIERQLHRNDDDTSFKLGVGCAFLYLIAASKNELHKMAELRKEMEMILQNVKAELQSKDQLKHSDALACSIADIQQVSTSNSHNLSIHSQTPYVQPESNCDMVHNRFLEYNETKEDECSEEIDELQAEFEFELERLHLYFDGEPAFGDDAQAQQERVKGNVKDSSSTSHSSSFGDIIMDPQGASADFSFAVPPVELERRLHELLEARLQERITELESALECTKQKLMEKEMEVTWWKDTARLISQHVPETSRFTFRLDPETALKLSHL